MTEQEIKKLEHQAYDGSINIDPLPAPEYRYFDRLRRLYEKYKFDKMPREFAERMKRIAYSEYRQDTELRTRYTLMYVQYQYNIKQAGTLRSELEKSDDIYDIADKAIRIVGLLTGDPGLRERMNTKLKGATNNEDIHTKIS